MFALTRSASSCSFYFSAWAQ